MNGKPGNTRLLPYEVQKVRQAVDAILSSATPVGAIASLVARAGSPQVSAFERYAGHVLRDAGASRLAELPPSCTVLISPPSDARLVRLTTAAALDAGDQALLECVEDAVNRLCCIADAIEDSGNAGEPESKRIGISVLGGGFLSNMAGYRSALVKLPEIGRAEQPDMAYFNEVDWRVLDHIASTAHAVFQSSVLPNMHQAFMGASGADGSDWDVRTRLATILETLELPLRYRYAFDVNVQQQAAAVEFTISPAASFPASAHDKAASAARFAYALRLACLLAAAVFGSGRRIERAYVTGTDPQGNAPLIACMFERKRFVYETLTAIDSGALADPQLRFDPDAIARIMAPEKLSFSASGEGVGRFDDTVCALRIEPHLDTRELPDDMKRLFHSRRVCDIDTQHYHGPGSQAVDEARSDSELSTVAAIALLENIVAQLEGDTAPPDDNAASRPLYCANPLSRAVVSLVDDERTVADQAEAFLKGDAHDDSGTVRISYFRAPDALYHAHMGLSDLYERLGDADGAQAQADRCIELAPTSAASYFRKSDILAQQSRFAEAANLLLAGLRLAVSPRDCALLYYHLALILWNTGRKREAVAVHVYTTSLAGEYAEKALKVVSSLRKRRDSPVIVYASPLAAAREMSRARIPVAPSDTARTLIVKAAVGLSCANAPEACAPYAAALASYFRGDRVIAATCRSIIHGVTLKDQPSRPPRE